jgi:ABC-type lipoprotein release transport system permease subunit
MVESNRFSRSPDDCQELESLPQRFCDSLAYVDGVACWSSIGRLDVPYTFNLAVNVLSFVFSAVIGVVFGYFPARRAARMDPIDALRHE